MTDFYQTFVEMMANVAGYKNVISADLDNVGQVSVYKNHYILAII